MDFPNVTLVLQVGLPTDADCYTHRVGRTARAGKDGRAVLLLTQAESFFLKVNQQFPIFSHPASDEILNDATSRDQIFNALQSVEPNSKQKAYSAYLGFMKGFLNKLKIDKTGLVRMANSFAIEGMRCNEVPEMEKRTIAKMDLKGVPGIRYRAAPARGGQPDINRSPPVREHTANRDGPSRRLRHQDAPEPMENFANGFGQGAPKVLKAGAGGSGDHGSRGGRQARQGGRGGGQEHKRLEEQRRLG